jgi:hypothetical protein
MKNSFGLPWHGSAFSSFFFSVVVDDVYPRAGKLSDMPRACFLALGKKAADPAPAENEVVGALYDGPAGVPPKGAKPAKPPNPAG